MKTQNLKLYLFLSLLLIYQITSLATVEQDIIQNDSEYAKAAQADDKGVCIITKKRGENKFIESKLNKKGDLVYSNFVINQGYTASAQLVQPLAANGFHPEYFLFYHNMQNLNDRVPQEKTLEFNQGKVSRSNTVLNEIYQQKSVVALQNGKVLIAGIKKPSTFGSTSEKHAEVRIYDPQTGTFGNGISFEDAYSKYISCYEQKANEVYCFYVSWEHVYVSKMRIKHLKINGNSITASDAENKKIVKNFYTVFSFIKAVRYNDNEAIVVFQTGNGADQPRYGNSGKDLYYYHLVVEGDSISIKRYEYLYDKCEKIEDPEDYKVDVAVLSENRVYVVCETGIGRLRGFILYNKDENRQNDWDEFNFNNFEAETVRNPVFAKFDKSLGIFYTHIGTNQNSKVALQLINYPDCTNYKNNVLKIPKHYSLPEFDFTGKVFMLNPYPASRADEKICIRFERFTANLTIFDIKKNTNIVPKIYEPDLMVKITPNDISEDEEYYALEYTAIRKDEYDGDIEGRTCKINFYTPKCLPQCYSCSKHGEEGHHNCLGCVNEHYYKEEDPEAVNEGWGKPHNCYPCDIACDTCYGGFLYKPMTTNCKVCDYANGYYHYVDEERTCIKFENKTFWEELYGPLYLDKTPGVGKESEWRWRHCHPNCASCSGPGDDEDNQCDTCKEKLGFYFYCNQTKGKGIPGSCHNNCVNNGFYLTKKEEMKKCCPCLEGCKVCQNETKCDDCFRPHYLMPDHESCVDDCGYCLAKDNKTKIWECVNCKIKYGVEKYNLNGTCYDTIPKIEYDDPDVKGKDHHIIDDTCNLLIGCKGGCKNCSQWYTEKCTLCFPNFFKNDTMDQNPQPPEFACFTERECHGLDDYKYAKNEKEAKNGGVAKIINGDGLCYNCKLREFNYRQVENNFTCGPRPSKTFIDIIGWNKLSKCYTRCASCEHWGNSCRQNCTSCRDSSTYGLQEYVPPNPFHEGECIRYSHKCKDLPYYHDYDLADELGIDEDNCGQDCDVCLTNRSCTENFPYYVVETRECVEICGFDQILNEKCLMQHPRAGFILLNNPFDLRNTFNPINQTTTINQIISTSLFQKFAEMYNVNPTDVKNNINNYLGNGQIYNLQNSQIIVGNNISIEITSVALELKKLTEKIAGQFVPEEGKPETSTLDLSQCQEILKKKYGLSEKEELMIIKGDTFKELAQFYGTQTDYQLFSTSLGAFLPLDACQEGGATVEVVNPFKTENIILPLFQNKISSAITNGYNLFDKDSPFYHDVCTPFTNENGNDVLLDDRINDYFEEQLNICDNGCTFKGYNVTNNLYTCECPIKNTINQDMSEVKEVSEELPKDFFKKHKNSNIEVFKCASQVFSNEGQKNNWGSYVLITCLASFVGSVVFYFIKGRPKIDQTFNDFSDVNQIPSNPPKPVVPSTEKGTKDKIKKIDVPNREFKITDELLNGADFEIAVKNDKRSYLKLYWSLLKMKQLFIFTFYTYTDYNLRIVKIALFILFLSLYFAFTALFFNDSIMKEIYIYKGNTNAAVHVPNIILSSLCCLIMNFIIRFVSLSERDYTKINCQLNENEKRKLSDKTKKLLKIKLIVLFAISTFLIGLCWYYVSAFCAVFKNSQGHYFINVFVAFLVCNIWPCVTSLIPPILRRKGLDGKSPCMYKASQIISYI